MCELFETISSRRVYLFVVIQYNIESFGNALEKLIFIPKSWKISYDAS